MASLSQIPKDVLLLLLTYLQCFADRVSLAGVCRDLRAAVGRLAVPTQLPWLLLPSPKAQASFFASFLSGCRRQISLPHDVRRADHFCGSHDGGWVAIAAGHQGPYALVNLLSPYGLVVPLPRSLEVPFLPVPRLWVRMITLSDKPTARNCIAAAHLYFTGGGAPQIAFCRPQVDRRWVRPVFGNGLVGLFDDAIYYRGEVYQGFYAINNQENLHVFMRLDINGGATLVMRQVAFPVEGGAPCHVRDTYGSAASVNRYLVESRGKLLMVVRHSGAGGSQSTGMAQRVLHFEVFEMVVTLSPDNAADTSHSASWVELEDLDGRVIFVGRGCSRAFEAGRLKGFQGGSIYFLDDAAAPTLHSMYISDVGTYSRGKGVLLRPGLPSPTLCATDQAASSYNMYGPRDLVICTGNASHATAAGGSTTLKIVPETDNAASNSEEDVVATVWPFSRGSTGNFFGPVWLLP
ncbi:hypothetical protein EJB05_17563, partial [Eragrostis curvula]